MKRSIPTSSRRALVISIVCIGVLATACARTSPTWWPFFGLPSPEDLAHEAASCGAAPARDVRVHAVHELPQGGLLLLFSGECPPSQVNPRHHHVRGHVRIERRTSLSFRHAYARLIGGSGPTPPDRFIEYHSGGLSTKSAIYAYVYGRVLSPEVQAVEALFDTGEVLRDDASDGSYGLITAGSRGACAVRVLGPAGQILKITSLALDDPAIGVPAAELRPGVAAGWERSQADPQTCAGLDW